MFTKYAEARDNFQKVIDIEPPKNKLSRLPERTGFPAFPTKQIWDNY